MIVIKITVVTEVVIMIPFSKNTLTLFEVRSINSENSLQYKLFEKCKSIKSCYQYTQCDNIKVNTKTRHTCVVRFCVKLFLVKLITKYD